MILLRSILFIIGMIGALLCVSSVTLLSVFFNQKIRYLIASRWAIFTIYWLKLSVGIDYRIIGLENLPSQPAVILSNHQSTWETLAFQCFLPPHTWVIKKQLLWTPVFGWALAMLKPVVIDRVDRVGSLKKVLAQGKQRLDAGIWLVIFPEGTRQHGKAVGHYQSSGVALAKNAKAPIVPIYHNSGHLWHKGQFFKRPGRITLVIGMPVDAGAQPVKALTKQIENWTKSQAKKIAQAQ